MNDFIFKVERQIYLDFHKNPNLNLLVLDFVVRKIIKKTGEKVNDIVIEVQIGINLVVIIILKERLENHILVIVKNEKLLLKEVFVFILINFYYYFIFY